MDLIQTKLNADLPQEVNEEQQTLEASVSDH
jgi:hypothetical protein